MKNKADKHKSVKAKEETTERSFTKILKKLFPWKGDKVSECIRKIIFLVSVIASVICLLYIYDYFYVNRRNQSRYEEVRKNQSSYAEVSVTTTQSLQSETDSENDDESSDEKHEFSVLPSQTAWIEINPDTVGYIYIKDSMISYPIVQKKTSEQKDYYLEHSFWNEEAKPGAIYLDWRNDLEAEKQSDNLVIYGHNMNDGTMFGQLKKYKDNHFFYGESPLITLSSNYSTADYKIFGFFLANADAKQGEVFEYYNYTNFNTEEEFYEYVNGVKIRSLVLNDVDVKYGDKLVTLSTCSGAFDEARFVVVGRKLRGGEEPLSGTENNSRNPNPLYPDPWYKIKGTRFDSSAEFIPYG